MPRPVRLETFSGAPRRQSVQEAALVPADAVEEARLEAFEKGYKAGWDDAVAAQEDEAQRLRADVGRNLQGLSFTYHEARGHLLRGLGPLMEGICSRLLPRVAQAALGGIVCEALEPLAEEALDRPVTLVLHPEARPLVEAALSESAAPPVDFVEEPSLAPGQLHLRWDAGEQRIDLDAAVAEIAVAVAAWFAEAAGETRSAGNPQDCDPQDGDPQDGDPQDGDPQDGDPRHHYPQHHAPRHPDPQNDALPPETPSEDPAAADLSDPPLKEIRRHG